MWWLYPCIIYNQSIQAVNNPSDELLPHVFFFTFTVEVYDPLFIFHLRRGGESVSGLTSYVNLLVPMLPLFFVNLATLWYCLYLLLPVYQMLRVFFTSLAILFLKPTSHTYFIPMSYNRQCVLEFVIDEFSSIDHACLGLAFLPSFPLLPTWKLISLVALVYANYHQPWHRNFL